MAFQQNNTADATGIPANKQARGFINLYLPRKNGQRAKLGAINLRKNFENENALAAQIEANPEAVLELLRGKLILEYNSATPSEGSGFDLAETAPETPAKGKGK